MSKISSNRLTPRLYTGTIPGAEWLYVDIGLWPKDRRPYCEHLTAMLYYQGPKRWQPPAGPINTWQAVLQEIQCLWNTYACGHSSSTGCSSCGGTDWKDYMRWKANGARIDQNNFAVL